MSSLRLLCLLVAGACFTLASCGGDEPPACVPTDEVCDGADNDCDGEVDESGCEETCSVGATECSAGRLRACVDQDGAGVWGAFEDCPNAACADAAHCLPCASDCATPGATECSYGAQRVCTSVGTCTAWSEWTPCQSGFCGDGLTCGTCGDACPEAGASECADGGLRSCVADANGCLAWTAPQACAAGFCADAQSCGECVNGCPAAGQTSCADGKQRTCEADANGCLAWGAEQPCADGFCLNASSCGSCQHECAAGATSCAEGKLRTCQTDSNGCRGWGAETACADGYCASATACGQCAHGCATVGATECTGGRLRSCVADANGCRAWSAFTDCADGFCATTQSCGNCNNTCPTSGQTECSGGQQRTCQADANGCLGWSSWSNCADGFCANTTTCGTCNDECSVVGATQCSSNRLRTCEANANGCLVWSAYSLCADGFCASATTCGACSHACATLGATECSSGQLRTCVADANGCRTWSSQTPCADGFCASATACGVCADTCSSAGAAECTEGQRRTCEADANGCLAWSSFSACAEGFCTNATACGTCSHQCATDGQTECANGSLRTCSADANGCRSWSGWQACPESYCASASACGSPPPPIVISEIRYDSTGSPDVGAFVELAGAAGTSLDGLSLVGVNGNGGADYNVIALTGSIPADGIFLVAHPNGPLAGAADQLASAVDYQNGPDSVQLRQGTVVLDAVGYGSFGSGDVFAGEGSPAPAVTVNWSLARDASLTDTDNNAADFSPVEAPTPGVATGSCTDACTAGATSCSAGMESSCALGSSGCFEWSAATSCASDVCGNAQSCDRAPTAAIVCPTNAMATQPASFDASGSGDLDGDVLTYSFTFGDGGSLSGTEAVVEHTFAATGTYTVTVEVTDPSGVSDTAQCSVTVAPFTYPDRIISTNTELCGEVRAGRFVVQGGATVTCTSESLTVLADEISIDPASAIDLSGVSSTNAGSDTNFCNPTCFCDASWVGGGGGGGVTAGTASVSTNGGMRSYEYGGCLGSCVSYTCSGRSGGSARGNAHDLSAVTGGAGGRGCVTGYSQCNQYYNGGKGGGAIKLVASRSITLLGQLRANGASGSGSSGTTAGAGGGGGGTVVLVAPDVNLGTGSQISAAGGAGGAGSKPSSYHNTNYANGGNGAQGRVKIVYGDRFTQNAMLTGAVVQSVMPPMDLRSTTHPDSSLAYNDTFTDFRIEWTAPFASVQGYWYALNKTANFALTPTNGTFTSGTSVTFPRSAFTSSGTWYFHVVTTDGTAVTGSVANRFPIKVNATPHTIASSSHPSESTWYTTTALAVSWTPPSGTTSASFPGFWYRLDRVSDSDTSAGTAGWSFTPNAQAVLTTDASGNLLDRFAYHFHLVAEDTQGNLTNAAGHFLFQIGSEPARTNVFGYVRDGASAAISGAAVQLEPYGLGATTDANGYFLIDNVYEGPYTLTANKAGFQPSSRSVQIAPAAMPLNVTLTP